MLSGRVDLIDENDGFVLHRWLKTWFITQDHFAALTCEEISNRKLAISCEQNESRNATRRIPNPITIKWNWARFLISCTCIGGYRKNCNKSQIIKKEINTKSKQQMYISFFSLMKCKINVEIGKHYFKSHEKDSACIQTPGVAGGGRLKKPSLLNPLQHWIHRSS